MNAVQQPQTRHQLWATFSVRDHCRRGAFIAEVLLYDKLLIPVLPTMKDGLSKEEADNEVARWKKSDWKPQRQKDVIEALGDRAEQIPWTAERQQEWRGEMLKSFADARRDGYFKTGTVLQRFAPVMARTVVAVSPVYSLAQLKKSDGIRRVTPRTRLPQSAILAVVGHELLVPSLNDGGYLKALERAVAVSRTEQYRSARQALYDWQQKFSAGGMTDAASIEAAVHDMKTLVDNVRTATREQKKWRGIKHVFSFFDVGFKFMEFADPVSAKVGGAFASIGKFASEAHENAQGENEPAVPAATMIVSAREKTGIS